MSGERRPIPEDFAAESVYTADAWFVHALLEISEERVRGIMDTTRLGALVDAQREIGAHFKHVPAGIAIHTAATLSNLHAVYALGLRPSEGWTGYGTKVEKARFPAMGRIGPEAELRADIVKHRVIRGVHFIDYALEYSQLGEIFFTSRQSAVWRRATPHEPGPTP